ncbi:hypothetical protein H0Z60_18720 [Ectothiorhodospiraceae bacterium WFHF3C12]|nr:hypothetical protein [Ectothiorhodospiraceae bacterium WFHF3C12]
MKSLVGKDAGGDEAARDITALVYLLQLLGFVTVLTAIAAVVVNYVKWDDVRDTWLESHFRWQVRTFWFSLLWGVVGTLLAFIGIGFLIIAAVTVWYLYRAVRGWVLLNERREVVPLNMPGLRI